ncbi:hypothetical protein AALO_G00274350 [Alosa alosa]|uniref:Uncharacterized protein n=1 Tax=Alosa alosa TaxID=278164 RepID=A0AAV6FMD3_9TELE|nr:hypothetical protein AALO_G00274350 [Alosa alosa]
MASARREEERHVGQWSAAFISHHSADLHTYTESKMWAAAIFLSGVVTLCSASKGKEDALAMYIITVHGETL